MSGFDTDMIDKLMAADAANVDINAEFEAIIQLRQDLAGEVRELNKEIEELRTVRDNIAEPYLAAIQKHEENIKKEIIERQKTYHCSFGQAIFRKGARKVVWNDDALLGYAVEHPEIEQFRTESEGKASVVLKIGDKI